MGDVWAKLDVDLPDHPKVVELHPIVRWVFVECLCWSRRFLTDGRIPPAAMSHIYSKVEGWCGMDLGSPQVVAERLANSGLLEANGDGWVIHDYSNYQQTKQMVQDRKNELSRIRSEAGRKGGQASAEARRSKSKLEEEEEKEKDLVLLQAKLNPQVYRCELCAGGLNFKTQQRLDEHHHVVHS